MTFFTVCEAIQLPAVARESVATMMPPWKRKASVVVPWAILMGQLGFDRSSVAARSHDEGYNDTISIIFIVAKLRLGYEPEQRGAWQT
jgi:hypothetical protein